MGGWRYSIKQDKLFIFGETKRLKHEEWVAQNSTDTFLDDSSIVRSFCLTDGTTFSIKKEYNTTTWSTFICESIKFQFLRLKVGQVKMVSFFKNVTIEEWAKSICFIVE